MRPARPEQTLEVWAQRLLPWLQIVNLWSNMSQVFIQWNSMKSILKHGVQIYEILLKSVQVHEVRSRKIGSTRAAHVRKTRAAVPGICLLRHYVQRARQTNSPPEFCTTWLLHTFATFAHDLSTKISGCILPWPAVSLHGFQHFRKSTQGTDTATKIHVQSSPTDEALEYPTLELFIVDIMRNTHYHSYTCSLLLTQLTTGQLKYAEMLYFNRKMEKWRRDDFSDQISRSFDRR